MNFFSHKAFKKRKHSFVTTAKTYFIVFKKLKQDKKGQSMLYTFLEHILYMNTLKQVKLQFLCENFHLYNISEYSNICFQQK